MVLLRREGGFVPSFHGVSSAVLAGRWDFPSPWIYQQHFLADVPWWRERYFHDSHACNHLRHDHYISDDGSYDSEEEEQCDDIIISDSEDDIKEREIPILVNSKTNVDSATEEALNTRGRSGEEQYTVAKNNTQLHSNREIGDVSHMATSKQDEKEKKLSKNRLRSGSDVCRINESAVGSSGADVEMVGISQAEVTRRKRRSLDLVKEDILGGDMLTDEAINLAQNLLHSQFPEVGGLEDTSLGPVMNFSVSRGRFVQVLHDLNCHWVCISNIGCSPGTVRLYDSLNTGAVKTSIRKQLAAILYEPGPEICVEIMPVHKQPNSRDCGVFAIAYATSLLYGQDPSELTYDVSRIRGHLYNCLKGEHMTPFPEADSHRSYRSERIHRSRVWVPLTCSCRMPYDLDDKTQDSVQCDGCGIRYHTCCEDIPPELLEMDARWLCKTCRREQTFQRVSGFN